MAEKPIRPEQKVVFGISDDPQGNKVLILQVPPGGWDYMKDGTCHTFDLTLLGLPFKILLSGCESRAAAIQVLEAANAAKGHGTLNMAGTDFGLNRNR